MATNHRISSNVHDGYHGAVKAKELHSQKQPEHGNMRAGSGEEGSKSRTQIYDSFDRSPNPVGGNSGACGPRDKSGETGQGHGEINRHGHNRGFDGYSFAGYNLYRRDAGHFLYGDLTNGFTSMYGAFQGTAQIYQFTQITITHSSVFSGAHFGSITKSNEARQNFLNAARSFFQNPSEQAYRSLNDAMAKLMDPRFTSATVGGAAKVSIRGFNGATMVKFTMEVTPTPTKTLEEAREDLTNAYSSKRDGEKGIAGIRAEAYTNYIRALSEKFKQNGVISHTNNTPTTPVYKASVIYVSKTTWVNVASFHEIKKPELRHNLHGRLTFKNQSGFWNHYRQNHKSYAMSAT